MLKGKLVDDNNLDRHKKSRNSGRDHLKRWKKKKSYGKKKEVRVNCD